MTDQAIIAPRPGPRQALAETLLVGAIFLIAAGDRPPHVNEQHYLGRLKHFWNPSWCEGDLFLESPDAHLTIVLLAGWTTKFFSLSVVAWGGRLLVWGLLAWAWRKLCWSVSPQPWVSVFAAGLWLVGMEQGHLAGEWVVGGVEAKCFAYVFVLLGLNAYLEERWNAVWVHLGIATALHALVGGWSVLILFWLWFQEGLSRPSFRSMLPSLALGAGLGLLGVAPPIVMNWSTPPETVAEANQIYVFERLPHHLAPLSKPGAWIAERASRHWGMLVLLAGATWWAWRRSGCEETAASGRRMIKLCRFAWAAALLMACGLALESCLMESPESAAKLLRYYWLRLSDVAAPLATAVVFSAAVSRGLQRKRAVALLGLCLAVGAIFWHLGPETIERLHSSNAPADSKLSDPQAWSEACQWVAENTPPEALFLVPQNANSFKWRAGRAEVVTYKDIPQDARSMVEWRRRRYEVYWVDRPTRGRWTPSLGHLGAGRLRELGREFGVDYVLTDQRRPASLPVVFRNRTYVVYSLRQPH